MKVLHRDIILSIAAMVIVAMGCFLLFQLYEKNESDIRLKYWKGECNFAQTLRLKMTGVEPFNYDDVAKLGDPKAQIEYIIENASEWGCLPFGHYYRIGFDPSHPGVVLDADIKAKHTFPKLETTWIYLQYRFHGLTLFQESILVVVYFNDQPSLTLIPIDAITYFDDPSRDYVLWPYGEPEEDAKLPD